MMTALLFSSHSLHFALSSSRFNPSVGHRAPQRTECSKSSYRLRPPLLVCRASVRQSGGEIPRVGERIDEVAHAITPEHISRWHGLLHAGCNSLLVCGVEVFLSEFSPPGQTPQGANSSFYIYVANVPGTSMRRSSLAPSAFL
jgi:hypothetical protein